MKILLGIIGIFILAIIAFLIYRYILVKIQYNKATAKRLSRVKALSDKLESGQRITEEDVLPFAKNLLTRQTTLLLLAEYDKTSLFPTEYNNLISIAESNLANWLEFPTELGSCPDEIEHIKRVSIDFDGQGNFVHYEVFKCKVNEPHWAAKDGWFLGVVGPYFDDSTPLHYPNATFSRLNSAMGEITPEQEARWVHENISSRWK